MNDELRQILDEVDSSHNAFMELARLRGHDPDSGMPVILRERDAELRNAVVRYQKALNAMYRAFGYENSSDPEDLSQYPDADSPH
jgi:hypothetical protein